MTLPSFTDLAARQDIIPLSDICNRLEECIEATDKWKRKSTVVVTYEVEWDEDSMMLSVFCKTKSKMPIRSDRNEEVLGDGERIFSIGNELAGQQRIPGADPVRDLVNTCKKQGVEMTITAGGRSVTIGKDAAAGELRCSTPVRRGPATANREDI